jgi:hypothetical protein
MASCPPYPPSLPPAATTRWQGASGDELVAMTWPTARAAPGAPAHSATSP